MIDFENKLPFRIYAGLEGQTAQFVREMHYKRRPIGELAGDFKLYSPNDRFLPFQIRLPVTEGAWFDDLLIDDWFLYKCDGTLAIDFSVSSPTAFNQISIDTVYDDGIYYTYKGDSSLGIGNLQGGHYYFEMHIANDNNRVFVSEVFYVPYSVSEYSELTLIETWNSCDIPEVLYQKGFKNRFYLEGRMLLNDPEIEEDGYENGAKEFIPTLIKYTDKYNFQAVVPEYIYHALLFIRMHDNFWITEPTTLRKGKFTAKKIKADWDNGGKICMVDVELEQKRRIVKGGCCENKTLSGLQVIKAFDKSFKIDIQTTPAPLTLPSVLIGAFGQGVTVITTGTITTSAGNIIQMNSNGIFTYSAPFPFIGSETFSYTIKDQYNQQSTATVVITNGLFAANDNVMQITTNSPTVHTIPTTGLLALVANVLIDDFIPFNITDPSNPIVGTGQFIMVQDNQTGVNFIEINRYTGQVNRIFVNVVPPAANKYNTFNYALKPLLGTIAQRTGTIRINY